jgi:hypothetical protein
MLFDLSEGYWAGAKDHWMDAAPASTIVVVRKTRIPHHFRLRRHVRLLDDLLQGTPRPVLVAAVMKRAFDAPH